VDSLDGRKLLRAARDEQAQSAGAHARQSGESGSHAGHREVIREEHERCVRGRHQLADPINRAGTANGEAGVAQVARQAVERLRVVGHDDHGERRRAGFGRHDLPVESNVDAMADRRRLPGSHGNVTAVA
jgi:hypothetical protein